MLKFMFLLITAAFIISCSKTTSTKTPPVDAPFYNSLWKMTIKSDTAEIVIDSVAFSSYHNNYSSPGSILFLNNFNRTTILSKPAHYTAYNYIGGWLLNTNMALPYDFQLAFILQYADTPNNQLDIRADTAYFKLNTDSTILYSTQLVHNTSFLFGQRYHIMDSIRLNRRR